MGWSDWARTVEVEPSIYAADFSRLGEQLGALVEAGAKVFHFDAGDGHFIPEITIGPVVAASIAPLVHAWGATLDCHLMVEHVPSGTSRRSRAPAATASPSTSRRSRITSPRSRTRVPSALAWASP